MPKVSVIITTHNRPHLLPRAVRSAKGAGGDVEVVVVDDASTDGTRDLCRSLAGIRYVRADRNLKMSGARNLGIRVSTAEYVAFLDDDDVRLPGSLDLQAGALDSSPGAGLIYAQALHGDTDCVPTGSLWPDACPQGDIFWELMVRNFIPCLSVVFRRSCLDRVGLLDEGIPGVDDWDLWLRIAELYPAAALEQPVAIWRQSGPGSGQFSSRPAEMFALSARLLRRRWLALPRAARAPAGLRREASSRFFEHLSEQFFREAARAHNAGRHDRAVKTFWTGLRVCPRQILEKTFKKGLRKTAAAFRVRRA